MYTYTHAIYIYIYIYTKCICRPQEPSQLRVSPGALLPVQMACHGARLTYVA